MAAAARLTRRQFVGAAVLAAVPAAIGRAAEAPRRCVAARGRCDWRADPDAVTLVSALRYGDRAARDGAVRRAVLVGSAMVPPLGETLGDDDRTVARAARLALQRVVRHCARPGAGAEAAACARQLRVLRSRGADVGLLLALAEGAARAA